MINFFVNDPKNGLIQFMNIFWLHQYEYQLSKLVLEATRSIILKQGLKQVF